MVRLRRLTVGSILGSAVALGAFATAAALSYSGKATANVPSTGAAPATSAPATSAPTSAPQTPQSTPRPTPPPTPAPAPFFGRSHASTGGS